MNQPQQNSRRLRLQFGFTGLFLVSLAVANLAAGIGYIFKARSGDSLDMAIFFCFTLLAPFLLAMVAATFIRVTAFFKDRL